MIEIIAKNDQHPKRDWLKHMLHQKQKQKFDLPLRIH